MDHVPEHLRDLATWICQKCTNTVPKAGPAVVVHEDDEPIRRRTVVKRRERAA